MKVLRADGSIQPASSLTLAWVKELQMDLEAGEILEQRMEDYPFTKWIEDLVSTGEFTLLED